MVIEMAEKKDVERNRLVLSYLAKRKKEFPDKPFVHRNDMLKDLELDKAVLDYHIKYLSEKYLIYVQKPIPHQPWTHANITNAGARISKYL